MHEDADTPIERLIQAHVEADHLFTPKEIRRMVADYGIMQRDVEMLVTELYGVLAPTPANRHRRIGGFVLLLEAIGETQATMEETQALIRADVAYLKTTAQNGGSKREKWGVGQWSVASAFIFLCATLGAAIIAAAFGG